MANGNDVFSKLRKIFGIGVVDKSKAGIAIGGNSADGKTVVPAEYSKDTNKFKQVDFSPELKRLYDFWLRENYDTTETLKNRVERYKDLDYMYYNSTIMSMATEMYADETVQADAQDQVLQVIAKERKVERYINEFFEKIGITQKVLRQAAFDLSLYGDHFWVNTTNGKEGITKIIPTDVYSIQERIEFNPLEIEKKYYRKNPTQSFLTLLNKDLRLQRLAQNIVNPNDDYSKFFSTYLFGYQFEEDIALPPWNVSHFRRFSTKSEFAPFGKPLFINCIAPFRQLQASKNLMALARANKFPKEFFQINTDENMSQAEQWEAVNEARMEYTNLGVAETGKEQFAIGGQIWAPKGLLEYELLENRMNLDDIADIELLRDDLIMGTRIPKGYLIVDRASFGTSGQALLQQFKPFGRAVYSVQTSILDELVQLVRLQFAMTGDFPYDTEFEITMSFPVIEESSDRLRMKSDTLRLANDVLSNLQSALGLGRGEAIPTDVVKDIFGKLSFINADDLSEWIEALKASQEEQQKQAELDKQQKEFGESLRNSRKKVSERLNEDLIKNSYLIAKKRLKMEEGVSKGRHYVCSFKIDPQQRILLDTIIGDRLKTRMSE